MAESKGSLLAKSVQKHAGRAKEKILQNLGKVDRTADDIFDEHLQNFTRQQNAANRLQKEFNNYIRCIRAVQTASKTLMDAISDVYESQWSGHDLVYLQTQNTEMLWQDFSHKLADQVLIPLNTYQGQFPEMKKKIDKRGRKLVDYDGQRHSFQALQASMAKKRDDVKIMRGREQLEEAKRTYEVLNSELHDELPALYDSRVLFLVTNLQTLFSAEQVFHAETSKVFAELEAIVDKLATDSQRGSYTIKKKNGSPMLPKPSSNANAIVINNGPSSPNNAVSAQSEEIPVTPTKSEKSLDRSEPSTPITPTTPQTPITPNPITPDTPSTQSDTPVTQPTNQNQITPVVNGNTSPIKESNTSSPKSSANNINTTATNNGNKNVEELYDIPVGATTDNLPPGVLYRVKATYKYTREDVDELSFEVGDVIRVIEYDDPEEQVEEGWLMGIKEGTNEKGMFPANFTRPL